MTDFAANGARTRVKDLLLRRRQGLRHLSGWTASRAFQRQEPQCDDHPWRREARDSVVGHGINYQEELSPFFTQRESAQEDPCKNVERKSERPQTKR
jgi:hypothetical protein